MSRSCQSATFSSAAMALARTSRARPVICSHPIGIALVRHRGRPLLPASERLLDLADFRLLQPADLHRKFLERRGQDRQRRHQLRMAVALDDLRRHRRRAKTEPLAHRLLDRRVEVREHPDGARQFADRHRVTGLRHAAATTLELRVPERELDAKGHRLGMHAMRPADHRRSAMLIGPSPDGVGQRVEVRENQVAGLAHLKRQRGVDHVRRREPEMEPACGRTDPLGHGRRKRDDVVLCRLLDFVDARDVEGAPSRAACGRRQPARRQRPPARRSPRAPPRAMSRSAGSHSRWRPFPCACTEESSATPSSARASAGHRASGRRRSPPVRRHETVPARLEARRPP